MLDNTFSLQMLLIILIQTYCLKFSDSQEKIHIEDKILENFIYNIYMSLHELVFRYVHICVGP